MSDIQKKEMKPELWAVELNKQEIEFVFEVLNKVAGVRTGKLVYEIGLKLEEVFVKNGTK